MSTQWLQATPFAKDLGLQAMTVSADTCRFILPYSISNTSEGAVHSGALAGLTVLCNHAMMRAADPTLKEVPSLVSLHIAFLRPAKTQSTWVESRLLARVGSLFHFETRLLDHDGKLAAQAFGTAAYQRGASQTFASQAAVVGLVPGFDALLASVPYLAKRHLRIHGVTGGRVELVLPAEGSNLDADGLMQEGAVAALAEAGGAVAAWSLGATAEGARGSSVALHLEFAGRLPAAELHARATVRARSGPLVWSDIDVVSGERLCAVGSVAFALSESNAGIAAPTGLGI